MATLIIISWRDVPAQVVVKRGRETAKVQLSRASRKPSTAPRCAPGKGSSDAYLADWKRSAPRPCGDDLKAEASGRGRTARGPLHRRRPRAAHPRQGPRSNNWRRQRAAPCRTAGRRNHLMYADAALVGASRTRPANASIARSSALLVRLGAAAGGDRLRAPRAAGGGGRARRQGLAVRLPDVRAMRAELDRHVLPDELSEEAAQRPVRRRARERQLRSRSRDALRLGRSAWRGSRTHPRRRSRRCSTSQPAVDRRLAGQLVVVARRAREDAGTPA